MKDKNGIEIECENCASVDYCKDSFSCEQCPCQNGAFLPSVEAYEARIKELQDELYADKYNYESWEEIKEEHQKLEATISDLKQKLTKKEQERRHESSLLNKRIVKLQKELNIVQESERAEAQEADRLRAEVKELGKKLTETVKLLGERSRECGKLEALLKVKNRSDISTQSTDTEDVLKRIRETDMSNIWWR